MYYVWLEEPLEIISHEKTLGPTIYQGTLLIGILVSLKFQW